MTLVVLLALLCGGWGESWQEIEQGHGRVHSLQTDFTQEKHLKILTRPIVAKGRLLFRSPDSLRWEYSSPVRTILLSHQGNSKRFVEAADGRLMEERGMNLDAMQMVLHEIGQWLDGRFTANPDFTADLVPGKKITLTPKNKGLAQMIGHIELNFADRPGVMESVVIYEGSDSYTKMVFTNEELNQEIPDALFMQQ
jgi:outer membrane lipoprotein-sorting protein